MSLLGAKKKTVAKKAVATVATPTQNPALLAVTAAVLRHPLVTEKAATMASHGRYAFVVAPSATKVQVSQAVLARYGVRPTAVNIMNVAGKIVRSRTGQGGRRRDWRKAIVTVPAGTKLALMENV